MRIKVLFFASYRELVGDSERTLDMRNGSTAKDVISQLKRLYPQLAALSDDIDISVNKRLAPLDTLVHDGDEIALIPPLSGG